jgi:hypothetical protein
LDTVCPVKDGDAFILSKEPSGLFFELCFFFFFFSAADPAAKLRPTAEGK